MLQAWKPWLLATLLLTLLYSVGVVSPSVAMADDTAEATDKQDDSSGGDQESSAKEPQVTLDTPRATFQSFLGSFHKEKFDHAAACLDFSKMKPAPSQEKRHEIARQLKHGLDVTARVNYADIPEKVEGDKYTWSPDGKDKTFVLNRGEDGNWRFSPELVEKIPALYESWKGKAVALAWYQRVYFGTELWKFGSLFFSILLAWIVGRFAKTMLTRSGESLEKRNRQYTGATLKALSRSVVPLALVFGLSIGLEFLRLHDTVREICDTVVAVLYAIAVAYVLYCLVDVIAAWLQNLSEKTESKLDDMLAPMVTTTARGTIIVLALVQIATILSDKPMTSVIAGLGVGGLAIGLAAQDMIKNFFGSLMIFSDQPFELGDRVVISGTDGIVETVGFRSTRIRTLDGHLVTMPNGDVANNSIRNVSARPNIKRSFSVTVTYDTPPDKVQRAIDILNEILHEHEGMDPETPARVFFNDMTDIALSIQVIYWYHPPEYWDYCAFSQWVNFEILHRFNAEGIEFAFPTQTLFLAGDSNRPLNLTSP